MLKKYFRQFIAVAICAALVLGTVFAVQLVRAVGRIQLHSNAHVSTYDISIMLEQIHDALRQQDQRWLAIDTELAIGIDTLQLELLVSAVPREFNSGSTATLTLQDESVPMQLNNGRFEGRVAAPAGEHFLDYRITLHSGGSYRNEQFQLWTGDILSIGGVIGGMRMDTYQPFGEEHHNMQVWFNFTQHQPFGDTITSARFFMLYGERELVSIPITPGIDQLHEFTVETTGDFRMFAELVGESGLTYRYNMQPYFFSWTGDRELSEIMMFEDTYRLRITNPAGDYIKI